MIRIISLGTRADELCGKCLFLILAIYVTHHGYTSAKMGTHRSWKDGFSLL